MPTDYHDFNKYSRGEDWDYNPDFEKIDARLELRGEKADRPASAPDGAKYVVDEPAHADHGAVYVYDSSASQWNLFDAQYSAVSADQLNDAQVADPADGTQGIQDAHDALPSSGGLIILKRGQYDWNNGTNPHTDYALHITKDNVAVVGQGWDSEIFYPANSNVNDGSEGIRAIHVGGLPSDTDPDTYDGIVLMNFSIDANWRNQNSPGNWGTGGNENDGHNIQLNGNWNYVSGVRSRRGTGDGIELMSPDASKISRFNTIVGNLFEDNWEQGMHNHGAQDTTWASNVVYRTQNNAVVHVFTDHTDTKNVVFDGNIIVGESGDNDDGVIASSRESTQIVQNLQFTNNIIVGHGHNGVLFRGSEMDGLSIKGNYIADNGRVGILGHGAKNLTIKDNDIVRNGREGITVTQNFTQATEGLFIRDNFVYNNNRNATSDGGIRIDENGQNVKNVVVADNDILSGGSTLHQHAIHLRQASTGGTVEDVLVRDNFVKGSNGTLITENISAKILQNEGYNTPNDIALEAEQPQDVSGSRTDNSWEQNTTGYPLQVYVQENNSGAGSIAKCIVHINTSQTNNVIMQDKNVAHGSEAVTASASFVVPPDHYYKVDVQAGINNWYEQKIGAA